MIVWISLIALLLPTYLIRFSVFGVPTSFLEVLIYLAVLTWLTSSDRKDGRLRLQLSWLIPAGLLLLGGMVGVLIAPDTREALGLFKAFVVDPLFVYGLVLVSVGLKDERHDLRLIMTALVVGASLIAGQAIWQALAQSEVRALGIYILDTNSSPNYLAFALAPVVPLIFVAIKQPWLRAVIAALLLWALVLTGSRAGIVAAVSGLAITMILSSVQFWQQSWIRYVCLGFVIAGLVGSWLVVRPDFAASSVTGGRLTSSTNVHWQIWGATSEIIRSHPLTGVGLGNYQSAFAKLTAKRVNFPEFITPEARTPHNLLIGLWTDLGLFGLAAGFAVIILVGQTLVRGLSQVTSRPYAATLIGSWFVLLAHGLVDMPIWKNDLMVLFWLLVALSLLVVPLTVRKRQLGR